MKTLRWLALVYSLLIVGVLVAPVPAEAAPTLTISVDFASPVSITLGGAGTCPMPAGYTACYLIALTEGPYGIAPNTFTLQNVSSTNPARVLIADTTGAGNSLDLFTLTGVKFVPAPASSGFTGQHTVQVVVANTFDAAPNPVGNYQFALRTGGYFFAGDGNNVFNFVKLEGSGDFGSGAFAILDPTNPTPLSMQVGSPTSIAVSFSLTQIQAYPATNCDNGLGGCTPTITQTLTFVVFGADTLFLTNSADGAGGNCDVVPPPADPKPPFGLPPGPANPCSARQSKIKSFFNTATNADNRDAKQAGADPFIQCADGDDCPCVDPAICGDNIIP